MVFGGAIGGNCLEVATACSYPRGIPLLQKTCPKDIRPAALLFIRSPLSFRNVEDFLHERGIEISHETVWPAPPLSPSGAAFSRSD
jgi:hypothetical protein